MRLLDLVTTSREVAATRSRRAKVAELAATVGRATPDELPVVVAFLAGDPRQDRLELGPAAVSAAEAAPDTESTLTVTEVDAALQDIADTPPGSGSRTARIATLTALLARATAEEQDWLRRLVVRDLRQGSLAGLLTTALAAAAGVEEAVVRRAAMLSGSLAHTAVAALDGGHEALAGFRLRVGTPLEPMLAATASSVAEARHDATDGADDAEVVVEAKLDGTRVQVHRDGDEVAIFSRNLREVTSRMQEVVAAVRSLDVAAVVLDGEVLALDAEGRPHAFQDTMRRVATDPERGRAGRTDDEPELALTVRFFDVLHLDGTDVLDRPLRERLEVLRRTVPDPLRVGQLVTADADDAEAFAASTLAAGHEGVMVKSLGAPYEAGRRGASWRKVKPVHTLDLVVLAAEWGSGRRRGWLSNLHLGARAEAGDPVDVTAADGTGLVMLGKTFKGLTDETLRWQTETLRDLEMARPDGYAASDAEEHRALHVRPELVVEIALDGLVRSTRYGGGLAMRFARVRGYRPDRDVASADTLATVRAIATGEPPPSG